MAAFALLFALSQAPVVVLYSYVYFRTGNTQDAEDLTARTFHQALANIRRYNERGLPLAAWLYRIAHNLVANSYRDRARKPQVPLDEAWPLLTKRQPK